MKPQRIGVMEVGLASVIALVGAQCTKSYTDDSTKTGETACGQYDFCQADEFCDWPDDSCGSSMRGPTCEKRNKDWLDTYQVVFAPIMGCNGKWYPNKYYAQQEGVDIRGSAVVTAPTTKCGEKDCTNTEYCEYSPLRYYNCGLLSGEGTCTTRPDICPQNILLVCGCDGKVYNNECEAKAVGVAVNRELSTVEREALQASNGCSVITYAP